METKHTPGPWLAAAGPSSVVGWPVVGQMGRLICNVSLSPKLPGITEGEWDEHFAEVTANARLIAAAPELLAALKEAVDDLLSLANTRWSEYEGTADELVGEFRALIAKAEGASNA